MHATARQLGCITAVSLMCGYATAEAADKVSMSSSVGIVWYSGGTGYLKTNHRRITASYSRLNSGDCRPGMAARDRQYGICRDSFYRCHPARIGYRIVATKYTALGERCQSLMMRKLSSTVVVKVQSRLRI